MKRYDLMHDSCEIEELDDGRFVRFDDVAPLIEALREIASGQGRSRWHAKPVATARAALEKAGVKP